MKNLLIFLFILLSTIVSNADWTQTNETHYLYVGGTVIQERSSNNIPLVTYTLGNELLARTDITNGIPARLINPDRLKGTGPGVPNIKGTAFYHHDANNNITAMIRSNASVVAQYTYDPYGGIVSKSGIMADINTYRFASREINPLAGIYAYHFRFYNPSIKRWLNQDPIGLFGGRNVFSFVGNDPINNYDSLGLSVGSEINNVINTDLDVINYNLSLIFGPPLNAAMDAGDWFNNKYPSVLPNLIQLNDSMLASPWGPEVRLTETAFAVIPLLVKSLKCTKAAEAITLGAKKATVLNIGSTTWDLKRVNPYDETRIMLTERVLRKEGYTSFEHTHINLPENASGIVKPVDALSGNAPKADFIILHMIPSGVGKVNVGSISTSPLSDTLWGQRLSEIGSIKIFQHGTWGTFLEIPRIPNYTGKILTDFDGLVVPIECKVWTRDF